MIIIPNQQCPDYKRLELEHQNSASMLSVMQCGFIGHSCQLIRRRQGGLGMKESPSEVLMGAYRDGEADGVSRGQERASLYVI